VLILAYLILLTAQNPRFYWISCAFAFKKHRAIARFIVAFAFAFAFQKDTSEASAIAFDFDLAFAFDSLF
jgi:hypothetical protein